MRRILADKKAHGGDTAIARFACRCQAVPASGHHGLRQYGVTAREFR